MKSIKSLLLAALTLVLPASFVLASEQPKPESLPAGLNMYVIERDMPGVGSLTPADLKAASQKSCVVLHELEGKVTWVHSYVTGDKLYCVYVAPDEDAIREHARRGGFPANRISAVRRLIDSTTAE